MSGTPFQIRQEMRSEIDFVDANDFMNRLIETYTGAFAHIVVIDTSKLLNTCDFLLTSLNEMFELTEIQTICDLSLECVKATPDTSLFISVTNKIGYVSIRKKNNITIYASSKDQFSIVEAIFEKAVLAENEPITESYVRKRLEMFGYSKRDQDHIVSEMCLTDKQSHNKQTSNKK